MCVWMCLREYVYARTRVQKVCPWVSEPLHRGMHTHTPHTHTGPGEGKAVDVAAAEGVEVAEVTNNTSACTHMPSGPSIFNRCPLTHLGARPMLAHVHTNTHPRTQTLRWEGRQRRISERQRRGVEVVIQPAINFTSGYANG